jgi:hypothetical protein
MKFLLGVQKIWTGHEIHGSYLQTPLVTLTFSWPGWNMGSAHRLHGLSIWLKFHEIPSRGSEDMNRTWSTWFKSSNTTGDLDLGPARLEHGFCMSTWWGEHLTKVSWNSFKGLQSYGPDTKCACMGRWKDGRADVRMDGRTTRRLYAPPEFFGEHNYGTYTFIMCFYQALDLLHVYTWIIKIVYRSNNCKHLALTENEMSKSHKVKRMYFLWHQSHIIL